MKELNIGESGGVEGMAAVVADGTGALGFGFLKAQGCQSLLPGC